MIKRKERVVIIGAGLAGLALATEIVDMGFEVEIVEGGHFLGGRASSRKNNITHSAVPIGPHVLASCYNNFFHFLKKIHARKLIAWERAVLLEVVHENQHHKIRFARLPGPFFALPWIFKYPFMGFRDKISNMRFLRRIYFSSVRSLEKIDGMNALEYLRNSGVSSRSVEVFWRFIVLSLLNVPLERCSAAELALLVKRWAYLKHRNFGFPKVGLGDLYADEAEQYILKKGGVIRRGTRAIGIAITHSTIQYIEVENNGHRERITGDIYVSTLNPIQLRMLLSKDEELRGSLEHFTAVPYISVNIWFDKKISHKQFWAMLNLPETEREYLNTDFYDFSNIYEDRSGPSYISSNIINSGRYEHLNDSEIFEKTLQEIHIAFPHTDAKPVHFVVHRIPYVVYAPEPNSRSWKQGQDTHYKNFFLAGDWTVRELPQCMEAAVRSGYKCAERILASRGMHKRICDDRIY
jgi:uncharacterized protein with NAD-binding domain and iron-sulfur cluster